MFQAKMLLKMFRNMLWHKIFIWRMWHKNAHWWTTFLEKKIFGQHNTAHLSNIFHYTCHYNVKIKQKINILPLSLPFSIHKIKFLKIIYLSLTTQADIFCILLQHLLRRNMSLSPIQKLAKPNTNYLNSVNTFNDTKFDIFP